MNLSSFKGRSAPQISKIAVLLIVVVTAVTYWPIVSSPLTADDIPNSQLRRVFQETPGGTFSNYIDFVYGMTRQWMVAEGRFFPVAVIYSSAMHLLFQGVGLYKIFLMLLGLANTFLIFRILRRKCSTETTLVAVSVFISAYSLRYPLFHDGISSFSGLNPAALLLLLGSIDATLAKIRYPRVQLALVLTLWTAASLTYEHVSMFVPGFLIICLFWGAETIRKRLIVGVVGVWIIQMVLALWLRSNAVVRSSAYQMSFDRSAFVRTSLRQLLAAFPGSQLLTEGIGFEYLVRSRGFNLAIAVVSLGFVILCALVIFAGPGARNESSNVAGAHFSRLPFAILGLNMLVAPAILTGATLRWQTDLPLGQGYLVVTMQSAGLALFVAWIFSTKSRLASVIRIPILILLPVALLVNIAWNWSF